MGLGGRGHESVALDLNRDSLGRFVKGNKIGPKGRAGKIKAAPRGGRNIKGIILTGKRGNGVGLGGRGHETGFREGVKLERVWIICPACGQQVEAVASDGWVKGYCAVAKAKIAVALNLNRDSLGHFVKGNKLGHKGRPGHKGKQQL